MNFIYLRSFGQPEWNAVLPLLGLDSTDVKAVPFELAEWRRARGEHGVELRGVKGLPKGTVVKYTLDPKGKDMTGEPTGTMTLTTSP